MGGIQTSLAMHLEDADPELRASPCIIDGPSGTLRGFTFEQLEKCTSRLAHGLREHGIREGSVVALLAPNLPEWALIFHATCSLGAILLPISLELNINEMQYRFNHSQVNAIITVPSFVEKVNKAIALPSSESVAVTSSPSKTDDTTNADQNSTSIKPPHLFVIGAAPNATSFGTLLQTGTVDWEYEARDTTSFDEGQGEEGIMSDDLVAVYIYQNENENTNDGKPIRQSITHEELLDTLLEAHGGNNGVSDDGSHGGGSPNSRDSYSSTSNERNLLGLEEGNDVVAGCLPFWRVDGLIGVMLQSCFRLCTVVTFDTIEARIVKRVVDDIGITVLPATRTMLERMIASEIVFSGKDEESTLCRIVCVNGGKGGNDGNDGNGVGDLNKDAAATAAAAREQTHAIDDAMDTLMEKWNMPSGSCVRSIVPSLTTLKQDTTQPIAWSGDGDDYIMPAFYRSQKNTNAPDGSDGNNNSSHSVGSGLHVTTDITLVCSNGVILEVEDVLSIMSESGKVQCNVKRNNLTIEVSGPWSHIFKGLAECHAMAHSLGSTTGVHTTMSMSSVPLGSEETSLSSQHQQHQQHQQHPSKQRRSSKTRRSSRSGSDLLSASASPSSLTPLSPEMKGMHAMLQQEEEALKLERNRHKTLQEQLARTKNQKLNMMKQNRDLKNQVEDQQLLNSGRKGSKGSQRSSNSPRNSFAGDFYTSDGNNGNEETKTRRSSFDGERKTSNKEDHNISTDPRSSFSNSDHSQNALVSPVKEVSSDEDNSDEADSRSSMVSGEEREEGNGYDDEIAMKEELEEDMRRLLQRGVMLFSENKANQAKPLFEEVVRIAHDLGNVAVEGRAVGNLASVFEATGQHHRAIELYMQCISILRTVGDSRKEARILYNVSHSYLSLERYDEAIDYLNQSLALTDDAATRQAVEQQLQVVRHAMIQQGENESDDDRIMDF